jgi:type I restriction enzyme S subunit
MTIENLITDNIDIWTAAIKKKSATGRGTSKKIELYGIKKLRELILELAVRGKLVPQDPNDEPASVLLERIAIERAQLIEDKKIKKSKKMPEIGEVEKPFLLPDGWEWVYNIKLFSLTKGKKPKDLSETIAKFSYLDIEALDRHNIVKFTNDDKCPMSNENDILVVCDGSRSGLILDGKNGVIGSTIARIDTYESVKIYIKLFFKQAFTRLNTSMKGAAIPHLDTKKLREDFLALPPVSEQHRIAAKVDELMALCDQLEQQTESSIDAHKTLVEVLLATLTDSKNTVELNQNWTRVSEFFDTLFTTEHSIDQLKQTILQLAVMGKLVPQDPNDEPASKLLERIAAEKVQLIKDKKIKKQKALPPITEEEKPFELPDGWEWCRIWDIAEIITSGSREWAKYYSDSGAIFVTMANLARGDYKLRLNSLRYVTPPAGGEGARTSLVENDLLISITGDVGNLGLIPSNFGEAYINQHTCLLRFMPQCQNKYFPELMRSPWAKFQFNAPQRGIKNSFRLGDVGEMSIPLPPKKEQERIAEKVDGLMSICDQLKSQLNQAQQTQLHLADAISAKNVDRDINNG